MPSTSEQMIQQWIEQGHPKQAVAEARKWHRKSGNSIETLCGLGQALFSNNDLDEALLNYKRAIIYCKNRDVKATIYFNLSLCAKGLNRPNEEQDYLLQCLQCAEDNGAAKFRLAVLYQSKGANEQAIALLDSIVQTIQLDNANDQEWVARACVILSKEKSYVWPDTVLRLMAKKPDSEHLSSESRVHYCFALAKIKERQGCYQEALRYYRLGNSIRLAAGDYPIASDNDYVTSLISNFSIDPGESLIEAKIKTIPIFILGMPRSGSTLLESRLSNHPDITALGEVDYFSRSFIALKLQFFPNQSFTQIFQSIKNDHLAFLRHHYFQQVVSDNVSTPFFIDKMPENYAYLGLIRSAIPESKVIETTRHPAAVIWSCFSTDFGNAHRYTLSLNTLTAYYLNYLRLMKFWKHRYKTEIYSQSYEDFIQQPDVQFKKVLAFCELSGSDVDPTASNESYQTYSASVHQIRQPIYTESLNFWNNFHEFFDAIPANIKSDLGI